MQKQTKKTEQIWVQNGRKEPPPLTRMIIHAS